MGNLSHTSGNVGIGTNTPTSLLHLYGSNPVLNIQNTAASAGSGGEVVFGHDQSGSTTPIASVKGSLVDGSVGRAGDLKFYTSSNGSLTEKMILTKEGRLGIGVASPTVALDVLGGVNISGTLTVGSLSVPTLTVTSLPGFTASGGILFPATPNLSSNRRVLDEYEEGTWTPKFVHRGGSNANWADLGVSYDNALSKGEYTRIGNVVNWSAELRCTNAPTAASYGTSVYLGIGGFPSFMVYTALTYPRQSAGIGYCGGFNGYAPVYGYSDSTSTATRYYLCGGAHSSNTVYVAPSHIISTGVHIMMSGTFLVG